MNNTHVLSNTVFLELDNLIAPASTKYDITIDDLKISAADIMVPMYVFKGNSPLESIVVYLKDSNHLKYSQIAKLLSRDQRTIWVTYSNAKKKGMQMPKERSLSKDDYSDDSGISGISLPLSLFSSRTLSVLEACVFYLRNSRNLSFNQIAQSLGKDYRTIWTVYRRAMKKL